MSEKPLEQFRKWERPSGGQVLIWLLLLGVNLILVVRDYGSHPAITVDTSRYVVLAQALLEHDTYRLISRAGAPPAAQFPFGYPLVLAPFVALVPGDFDALRVPSTLATLASAALLFWGWPLLSRRSYWWGLAIIALFCTSPITMLQARLVLSEAVFLVWMLTVILLVEWGVRRRPPWWWYVALASAAIMMVFTRTVGWAMWAGVVLYWLHRKRKAALAHLALLAMAMAVVTAIILAATPVDLADLLPVTYAQQSNALISGDRARGTSEPESYAVFLKRAIPVRITQDLPSAVIPALNSNYIYVLAERLNILPILLGLGAATTLIMAVGFWRWQRTEGSSAFLFAALPYFAILVAWSWKDRRFLHPVQPQMFLAFLVGLEALALGAARLIRRQSTMPLLKPGLAAVVAIMVSVFIAVSIVYPDNRGYVNMLEERSQWLSRATPAESIVASTQPETDFLLSGRRTVQLPRELAAPEELASRLARDQADFVIVEPERYTWGVDPDTGLPVRAPLRSQGDGTVLQAALALASQNRLELVYTAHHEAFYVFSVPGRFFAD